MKQITFNEEEHKYFVDGVEMPSVTEILEPITSAHYGDIPKQMLEQAARKGTLVHEATQMLDYGCEVEVFPEIIKFVEGYIDFENTYYPEWEGIEEVVHSEEYGFCGTLDRHGKILKDDVVLDIKTTSSPTYENYLALCCQTSAYALAIGKIWAKRYGLYLKSDGTFRLFDCQKWEAEHDLDSLSLFMKCLDLKKQINKSRKKRGKKDGK